MIDHGLPDDVQRFLRERIRSVGQVEVLLLLRGAPERWWSPDEVNRELRSLRALALAHLQTLRDARLLEHRAPGSDEFRFQPANAEDALLVARLSELFRDRMAAVIQCIYAPRQDSIREFADAFRLKKKKEGPDDG